MCGGVGVGVGGGGTGEMPIMECVAVEETMKHGKRVSFRATKYVLRLVHIPAVAMLGMWVSYCYWVTNSFTCGLLLLSLALLHPALVSAKERSTQLCVMGCEGVDERSVVYRCGSVSGRCAHVVTVPALP